MFFGSRTIACCAEQTEMYVIYWKSWHPRFKTYTLAHLAMIIFVSWISSINDLIWYIKPVWMIWAKMFNSQTAQQFWRRRKLSVCNDNFNLFFTKKWLQKACNIVYESHRLFYDTIMVLSCPFRSLKASIFVHCNCIKNKFFKISLYVFHGTKLNGFEMTWGGVNDARIFIFGWTISLKLKLSAWAPWFQTASCNWKRILWTYELMKQIHNKSAI